MRSRTPRLKQGFNILLLLSVCLQMALAAPVAADQQYDWDYDGVDCFQITAACNPVEDRTYTANSSQTLDSTHHFEITCNNSGGYRSTTAYYGLFYDRSSVVGQQFCESTGGFVLYTVTPTLSVTVVAGQNSWWAKSENLSWGKGLVVTDIHTITGN